MQPLLFKKKSARDLGWPCVYNWNSLSMTSFFMILPPLSSSCDRPRLCFLVVQTSKSVRFPSAFSSPSPTVGTYLQAKSHTKWETRSLLSPPPSYQLLLLSSFFVHLPISSSSWFSKMYIFQSL